MCYYITTTLPAEADTDRVREIAKRHYLAWVPVDNPEIQKQLRRGVAASRRARDKFRALADRQTREARGTSSSAGRCFSPNNPARRSCSAHVCHRRHGA